MKKLFILFLSVFWSTLHAQNIPQGWEGEWVGLLEIYNAKGNMETINMELHINSTDKPGRWRYTIIFSDNEGKDQIEYFLVKIDSLPYLYEVEEDNGLIIYEILMGHKMFQGFEVNKHVYCSITSYEKNKITWELVSDDETINYRSGKGKTESPSLTTFLPDSYQCATLIKKKK